MDRETLNALTIAPKAAVRLTIGRIGHPEAARPDFVCVHRG